MATQIRDNILAITLTGTGSTQYRVAHDGNISSTPWSQLPIATTEHQYLVRHDLPNTPGNYTISAQMKNSLHESQILTDEVTLLSNINTGVSSLMNKLRIAQSFGPNVTPTTMFDEIKCYNCFVSLYNNSTDPIDLANVKLWTRYQLATSTPVYDVDKVTILSYSTTPDTPATFTPWASVTLSGIIQPGKYFLILGPKATTVNPKDTNSVEQVKFTTGTEGVDDFHVDLDLSASSNFYVSSKFTEIFLSDATLTEVPASIYASGALCSKFIDLYGATSSTSTFTTENYEIPNCIYNYFNNNSKQQVKTIKNPTIAAIDNLSDYTSTSIKSLTSTTIRTSIARPRNSNY